MTNRSARTPANARAHGMTMRVYTVDPHGTIIRDRGTVTVALGGEPLPVELDTRFPPCGCPRCRTGQAVRP